MKKFLLILVLIASFVIGHAQGTLTGTVYTNEFCKKLHTETGWEAWVETTAVINLYKSGNQATKVVITTPGVSTLTLYVYAEDKIPYDNGDYRYILYCYEAGDVSSKTYDKTEFFRITDYKDKNYSVAGLFNRDQYDYAWNITSFTKY